MKPMIWHPEPEDQQVNHYLKNVNHAPYFTIAAVVAVAFCLVTFAIVMGAI
ncbi:hypothetical protein CKA32_000414 [Geitlerinema sp. FC II]|uniref:hypothetical protein n=1 Tax=Baaleninema simplex TaxID=2862350 RepID=UPI000348B793|nr:hypothetical protein [Baaleninema simplex]MDC0834066.1 hypothetical protein [Geitlerinema sp. CS-897]PPT09907.1 hypothetical protein CKA32_000414 [Geitlerinema sp. FC II]